MARTSKGTDMQENESSLAVSEKEIKLTPVQLADLLTQNQTFELQAGKRLVIHGIDPNDFLNAVTASDHTKRLQVLQFILSRYSLDIAFEGSITLGEFNISEFSWNLSAGASGSLRILSKPSVLRRSIGEIVAFLNMLPVGQAFILSPRQDLLLSGLSSDAMLDYYQFCQEHQDGKAREKEQDALFKKACSMLDLKGLHLKVYGLNAAQVDRAIDVNAGGILFRAVGSEEKTSPALVLALLSSEEKKS